MLIDTEALPRILVTLGLAIVLLAIGLVDVRQWRIPDGLNFALLGLGLVSAILLDRLSLGWALASSLLMLVVGIGVRRVFERVRGQHGLGLGDVKFMAAAASLIGIEAMPLMVLVSSVAALIVVALNHLLGNPLALGDRIYFGPFLSVALFLIWIVQQL